MRPDNDSNPVGDHSSSAIILTGGKSSRMGRPKAWLDLGGEPALVRVAEILRPLANDLVVVAAASQELPEIGARVVRDRVPNLGPLPALGLGLETVACARALVLACDTPLARPALLARLVRECRLRDASAVIPVWDDRAQPLVAVYHRRLATPLAALATAGERCLRAVCDLPGVQLMPQDRLAAVDPAGVTFRTMNTPEEYAAIRRAWPAPGRGD